MAELRQEGEELVLHLSAFEKAEAVHGDLRVPMAQVVGLSVVEDIVDQVQGLKLPGSRSRAGSPSAPSCNGASGPSPWSTTTPPGDPGPPPGCALRPAPGWQRRP